MSMQKPVNTHKALPVAAQAPVPTDAYFSVDAAAPRAVKLRALTALEEMYGYYGADLA